MRAQTPRMKLQTAAAITAASVLTTAVLAQPVPSLKRTPIASHALAGVIVDHVPVVRIDFNPAQRTGRHTHPMPVIGYVLEGSFVVKVAGKPEQRFTAGQSILEPANTVIERFDNESATKPAILIAHYLAAPGQTELIHLLSANGTR
jgi:quercetin dioxygenase-like cupin family protein